MVLIVGVCSDVYKPIVLKVRIVTSEHYIVMAFFSELDLHLR